ncbi:MAG: hypothetical protein JSW61_01940 [Candidatus Thorarchaeota archaeon]|nr:MAG: hypothetical protein JSW61_01940 [Candidatus Thorarchaeota archaeon]
MTRRLFVNISGRERDVVLRAILYSSKTVSSNLIPDQKVVFFGPSENLLVTDQEVRIAAMNLVRVCDINETMAQITIRIEREL